MVTPRMDRSEACGSIRRCLRSKGRPNDAQDPLARRVDGGMDPTVRGVAWADPTRCGFSSRRPELAVEDDPPLTQLGAPDDQSPERDTRGIPTDAQRRPDRHRI